MIISPLELVLLIALALAIGAILHMLWLRWQDRRSGTHVVILGNEDLNVSMSQRAYDRLMLTRPGQAKHSELH